jgi:hypothetical protein
LTVTPRIGELVTASRIETLVTESANATTAIARIARTRVDRIALVFIGRDLLLKGSSALILFNPSYQSSDDYLFLRNPGYIIVIEDSNKVCHS